MELPIYQVDAFAGKVFQGNPAAVCPLDGWLPDETLQAIAAENNLSETAFTVPAGSDYDIRWFTPNKEVDLCGHATLATAYVLLEYNYVKGTEVKFISKSGQLTVTRESEMFTLDFPSQPGIACPQPDNLVEALGARPLELFCGTDYMAVFDSEASIRAIEPDMALLSRLALRGLIITAPGQSVDFVSRFFAPRYGIPEDPVTGSAHCMLTPYWAKKLKKQTLSALQLSKRQGSLSCELRGERVLISGKVVPYLKGHITL